MSTNKKSKLDLTMDDLHVTIYEVDGKRGTIKELSDYFNVDPISVSDLIEDGVPIQDALCMADKGFKPESKSNNILSVSKEVNKKGNKAVDKAVSPVAPVKEVKEPAKVPVIVEVPKEAKTPYPVAVEKPVSVEVSATKSVPVEANIVAAPVSTKAFTDVQDLGDIIVITTTTTVVYRKECK